MGETYIETYLGCKIYYTTEVSGGTYYSPCITGYFFEKSAVKKRICTGQGGTWDGSKCSLEDGNGNGGFCSILGDTLVETYLGCPLCYTTRIVGGAYYSECVEIYRSKLADAKKDICLQQDGVWDGTTCHFEEPPECYADQDCPTGYVCEGGRCVYVPPPTEIPTTMSIRAPDQANIGETFTVYGALTETGTGLIIPDQPINISYNGTNIGSGYTNQSGSYYIDVSIPEAGVWTLKAEFPGATGYAASSGTTRMGVGVSLTKRPYIAILPIVTGLAIAHLFKR